MRSIARLARACAVLMTLWASGLLPIQAVCAQEAHADQEHAAHAEEHAAEPNPLAIDLDLAVWTFVIFLTLLGVLSKFAWPAISEALEERERNIERNIAAAAATNEEAKRLLAEHEARLAATAGEVRALLEEARRDADVTKRRIEEEGRKAAAEEVSRATREIERAKDGALHDLAVTSANLAIELGQKVVREKLEVSPEHQNRIVRDALDRLAAATANNN